MIIIKFPARKEAINGEAKRDIKMKIITQAASLQVTSLPGWRQAVDT